jgi:hypothetical protein
MGHNQKISLVNSRTDEVTRGGVEWEAIKILSKNLAYVPISYPNNVSIQE